MPQAETTTLIPLRLPKADVKRAESVKLEQSLSWNNILGPAALRRLREFVADPSVDLWPEPLEDEGDEE